MQAEPETKRGEQGERPSERVARTPGVSPTRPKTHRDQGRAPGPELGQQPVGQIHALLHARADLHRQRHVQHLWGRCVGRAWGRAREEAGTPVSGPTWFMPRTICWNLVERFMRAQPPPFLYTRSMGHPTLMSTKSTSMVRFRSSAHLVMVSGKAPSSCARWQGRGQGPDQAVPSWTLPTGALEPLASSSLNWL